MSNRKRIGVCLLTLGFVTTGFATEGQNAEAEESIPEQRTLREYVEVSAENVPDSSRVASKHPVPMRLTPAAVSSVNSLRLEEQGAAVLGDALHNVSGINVQGGAGVQDYFVLRGFNSLDGALVLYDGAAEPEASFYPMYNVEGVEVLKGPGGVFYGRDPLAGTVNIVRKQPLAVDRLAAKLSAGSFDTFEGGLDWNRPLNDRVSFRLNAFYKESARYRDDMDSQHFAINPVFRFELDEASSLTLNLEYADAEFAPDSGIPLVSNELAPVPRRRSYQTPFDSSEQEVTRFQLDYERKLSDRLTVRNKLYYRGLDWVSQGTLINGTAAFGPSTAVIRTFNTLDDDQDLFGNQLEAVVTLDTGRVRHELLAGIEVSRFTDEASIGIIPPIGSPVPPGFAAFPTIDLDDPVETFDGNVVTLPFFDGDAKSTTVAPYLIDQMRFSDKYHLLLGVRYDDIDFEEEVRSADRDDSDWSPMAGFAFTPNDTLTLYANAGRSIAPASPRVVGDLDPEESQQVEVGLKEQFCDDRVRMDLSVYELERDNIAILDDNGITQQEGDQRSRGAELELSALLGKTTRVFFTYAYTDAELTRFNEDIDPSGGLFLVDRAGNRPPFAPEHLSSFWVSGDVRRWGLAGGMRYIGEQYIAADNIFEIDDALVFDAGVTYDVGESLLRLNLKNLTDEEYAIRGFGSASVIPADGFSAQIAFEFRR